MTREQTLTLEEFETMMREFDEADERMARELKTRLGNWSGLQPNSLICSSSDDLSGGSLLDHSWQITQPKAPTSVQAAKKDDSNQ
ncbi:hypothetical protein PSH77_14085 [Pseudomonas extremorientalis]|uniref:hypothetical protein n=1 Tax=Pseudomonas extremorientalis TaxID=169669 RepID=UPI0027365A21|nr:hypothetical protein [Pseudomonas extremorientalis]WLG59613.1 hypothetical protein PSH77_14085 [Pseudomonas extremorientalis]